MALSLRDPDDIVIYSTIDEDNYPKWLVALELSFAMGVIGIIATYTDKFGKEHWYGIGRERKNEYEYIV